MNDISRTTNLRTLNNDLKMILESNRVVVDSDKLKLIFGALLSTNVVTTGSIMEKTECYYVCLKLGHIIEPTEISNCAGVIEKLLQHAVQINCNEILSWCIMCLSKLDASLASVLSLLTIAVSEDVNIFNEYIHDIINPIYNSRLRKPDLINDSLTLIKLLAFVKLVMPSVDESASIKIQQMILYIVQHGTSLSDKMQQSKLIVAILEAIMAVCEKYPLWIKDQTGTILGIALGFSSYGLSNYSPSVPQYLLPSPLLQIDHCPLSKDTRGKTRRRVKKNVIEKAKEAKEKAEEEMNLPEIICSQTSESDFSDSEGGQLLKLRKAEKLVRITSLSLLLTTVRTALKSKIFGYWSEILTGRGSIVNTLKVEYSSECKVSICAVLMVLFSDGKMFLAQAQHSTQDNLPYTSWSCLVADLITNVHSTLCLVLIQCKYKSIITSILRCLTVLIYSSPYYRLKPGILATIVNALIPSFSDTDHTIRVAALRCFQGIISLAHQTTEQSNILKVSSLKNMKDIENKIENSEQENSKSVPLQPWIIRYCFDTIQDESALMLLRSECYNTLRLLIKHHSQTIFTSDMKHTLYIFTLKDIHVGTNVLLQQTALKCLEQFLGVLLLLDEENGMDAFHTWNELLRGPLMPCLQGTHGPVVAAACDCLSNITLNIFEQFQRNTIVFIMTVLFSCANHDDPMVRSASIRTLGTIVRYPCFCKNDCSRLMIYDVASRVCTLLSDGAVLVRSQAAWALGNLSETLITARDNDIEIDENTLFELVKCGTKSCMDQEKIRISSVRALGFLLILINAKNLLKQRNVELVNDAVNMLSQKALHDGNMKVRWNACYALGNLLKNDALVEFRDDWKEITLYGLGQLVENCRNFKVRQASASGLMQLKSRKMYEPGFQKSFSSIIVAMHNALVLPEFFEYKHQQNLIDQLCIVFCHFVTLFIDEDVEYFQNILFDATEVLDKCFNEFRNKLSSSAEIAEIYSAVIQNLDIIATADHSKRRADFKQFIKYTISHI